MIRWTQTFILSENYRVVPGEDHPFYRDVFMPMYNKYVKIASAVMELSKY